MELKSSKKLCDLTVTSCTNKFHKRIILFQDGLFLLLAIKENDLEFLKIWSFVTKQLGIYQKSELSEGFPHRNLWKEVALV